MYVSLCIGHDVHVCIDVTGNRYCLTKVSPARQIGYNKHIAVSE